MPPTNILINPCLPSFSALLGKKKPPTKRPTFVSSSPEIRAPSAPRAATSLGLRKMWTVPLAAAAIRCNESGEKAERGWAALWWAVRACSSWWAELRSFKHRFFFFGFGDVRPKHGGSGKTWTLISPFGTIRTDPLEGRFQESNFQQTSNFFRQWVEAHFVNRIAVVDPYCFDRCFDRGWRRVVTDGPARTDGRDLPEPRPHLARGCSSRWHPAENCTAS